MNQISFEQYTIIMWYITLTIEKMNAIITMFLLVGNNFMPELNLMQLGFSYSSCTKFTKMKKKKRNMKIQRNWRHQIHLSKWIRQDLFLTWYSLWCVQRSNQKNRFWQNIIWQKIWDFGNTKYNGCQRGLTSIDNQHFNKKPRGIIMTHRNRIRNG